MSKSYSILHDTVFDQSPLWEHVDDSRVLLKAEGCGRNEGHKFRSASYLALQRAGGGPVRAADRSSGSWAMALAFACHVTGGESKFVTVGSPPPFVKDYVESHNGSFRVVSSNRQRIIELEALAKDGFWLPDQHNNPQLIDAFHESIGLELVEQLRSSESRPRYVVAPVGTGGLLGGVTRALRQNHFRVTSVGVDLASSINHLGPRSWKPSQLSVRGVGSDDEICGTLLAARRYIDETLPADVFQAGRYLKALQKHSARGVGMSGALALAVTHSLVLPRCKPDDRVVVVLPDSGDLYQEQTRRAGLLFAGGDE